MAQKDEDRQQPGRDPKDPSRGPGPAGKPGSGNEDSPKLGAAGTGPAGKEQKHQSGSDRKSGGSKPGEKKKDKPGLGTKAAMTGAGVAIGATMGMGAALAFRMGRSAMISATRLIMNAVRQLFKMGLKALVNLIAKPLMAAGGALSSGAAAIGISGVTATGGAIAVGTAATLGVGGGVATVTSNNQAETAIRDGSVEAMCEPAARDTAGLIEDVEIEGEAEENAELIYSVLAAWGMPDENIAGIVGNWHAESRIDPTGVETVSDEPHQIGPRKQEAWDLNWDIATFNPSYAAEFPGIDKMGIGLGQWTNERNTLLENYAESNDNDWHDITVQLAFMFSEDDPVRVAVAEGMIDESRGSVEDATTYFMSEWEGLADGSTGARISAAEEYMGKFSGWDADQELADSILEQVGNSGGNADASTINAAIRDCDEYEDRRGVPGLECADPGTGVKDFGYGGGSTDIEDILHPNAVDGFLCGWGTWGSENGGELHSWHSYRPAGSGAGAGDSSDHTFGAALDISITHIMDTGEGQRYGRDVAEWYMTHAEDLNVTTVIFWERYWNPSMGEIPFEEWDTYSQNWCSSPSWSYLGTDFPVSISNPSDPSHNCSHRNHPHVSFENDGVDPN